MYAIHTTPGFILDSRPYGEADKLLSIFTRDFGLVTATAQGIRFEKSKLRYFCQDYSFGTFSLVRGKEFWRLTSAASDIADSTESANLSKLSTPSRNSLIARMALLLRRLLHGEEANPDLFEALFAAQRFLMSTDLTEEQGKALESITVLRIMHHLGYVGGDAALRPFIDEPLSSELLQAAGAQRAAINAHINKALKESHL